MKIKTENQMNEFKNAIAKCTSIVWVVTPDGRNFNMKDSKDYKEGMKFWENDENDAAEVFTSNYEDEAIMMHFFLTPACA